MLRRRNPGGAAVCRALLVLLRVALVAVVATAAPRPPSPPPPRPFPSPRPPLIQPPPPPASKPVPSPPSELACGPRDDPTACRFVDDCVAAWGDRSPAEWRNVQLRQEKSVCTLSAALVCANGVDVSFMCVCTLAAPALERFICELAVAQPRQMFSRSFCLPERKRAPHPLSVQKRHRWLRGPRRRRAPGVGWRSTSARGIVRALSNAIL